MVRITTVFTNVHTLLKSSFGVIRYGRCETSDQDEAPIMSYEEAITLATNKMVFSAVVDAIRFRVKQAENSEPAWVVRNLKVNLAAALMDCANVSPSYDAMYPMYEESETILLSVLKEWPDSELALNNLNLLRFNKAVLIRNEVGMHSLSPFSDAKKLEPLSPLMSSWVFPWLGCLLDNPQAPRDDARTPCRSRARSSARTRIRTAR